MGSERDLKLSADLERDLVVVYVREGPRSSVDSRGPEAFSSDLYGPTGVSSVLFI